MFDEDFKFRYGERHIHTDLDPNELLEEMLWQAKANDQVGLKGYSTDADGLKIVEVRFKGLWIHIQNPLPDDPRPRFTHTLVVTREKEELAPGFPALWEYMRERGWFRGENVNLADPAIAAPMKPDRALEPYEEDLRPWPGIGEENSPQERNMAALWWKGYDAKEIHKKTKYKVGYIYNILRRLRRRYPELIPNRKSPEGIKIRAQNREEYGIDKEK